jgi:hypothetical protein
MARGGRDIEDSRGADDATYIRRTVAFQRFWFLNGECVR